MKIDPEWSYQTLQGLDTYLTQLDGTPYSVARPITLSGERYDGCDTCRARESLWYFASLLPEAYKSGQIVGADD